jgi:hypothetical protein
MSCIRPLLFDTPCTITKLLGIDPVSKMAFISSPQSCSVNVESHQAIIRIYVSGHPIFNPRIPCQVDSGGHAPIPIKFKLRGVPFLL